MDIDSDGSDRWEDFFGSSTDLAPSVIGYYDSLTNASSKLSEDESVLPGNLAQHTAAHHKIIEDSFQSKNSTLLTSSGQGTQSSASTAITKTTSIKSSTVSVRQHRNFRVFSPTVQRMISNSDILDDQFVVTSEEVSQLGKVENSVSTSSAISNVLKKSFGAGKHSRYNHIHIPLSKNTSKLSQSGNELVETFESSRLGGGYSSADSLEDLKTPTNNVPPNKFEYPDDARTPTNQINKSFSYDPLEAAATPTPTPTPTLLKISQSFDEAVSLSNKQIESVSPNGNSKKTSPSNRVKSIIQRLQYTSSSSSTDNSGKYPMKSCSSGKTADFESSDDEKGFKETSRESSNFYVKLPAEIQENIDQSKITSTTATTTVASKMSPTPKLTYSRAKILGNKPISSQSPPKAPPRRSSIDERLQEQEKKADDSPTPVKSNSLEIPEISKLKHRPLSASSICSTSSSSSSGSESHQTKLGGTSYLASVESLADQSENEIIGNCLTQTERAAMEIVDSERSYVEDLGQVIRGYLDDWKERACLKIDELKTLFSNIREIFEFNSILLKQLINSGTDPVKLAKCFIAFKDKFDVYTVYCTRYPEAISLLTSLLQASHTNALLRSTQKMLGHDLPLGSYLLKPVQRILKYHLLLDNLRKHCDISEVAHAHELMKEVASHIDQVKKNLEQQSRVKELSGILDGWLGPELTVLGNLIHEGMLMENNKPRVVFLFQTMLIITKPKEDNRLQFKTYIIRKEIMLVEHLAGEPTSFHVIPYNEPRHQIKLTARNREQKRIWAQHIKSVIMEDLKIPKRAKELVYLLGNEEDRTPDKGTRKWSNQSSTPEYLERRNQYRRSEIRYQSKKARKKMISSVSLENFAGNNSKEDPTRVQSKDELMTKPKIKCDHHHENCGCDEVKSQLSNTLRHKNLEGSKDRSRSKSESRLPDDYDPLKNDRTQEPGVQMQEKDEDNLSKSATLERPKTKAVEVKMYNTKTLPKRIANMKKNRSKTLKETCSSSIFYRNLPEDDTTVLRITESTDNLSIDDRDGGEKERETHDAVKGIEEISPENDKNDNEDNSKKDAEIITELLKGNKEFEKILKKPPKKKSIDSGKQLMISGLQENTENADTVSQSSSEKSMITTAITTELKTTAKSEPPEGEEDLSTKSAKILLRLNTIQNELTSPEPIYESLLRNVHVPYKSPLGLNRSFSQQYNAKINFTPKDKAKRPDSDYVTLVYSEEGLQSIDGTLVQSIKTNELSQLRNSDSNINYNKFSNESITNTNSAVNQTSQDMDSNSEILNSTGSSSSENLERRGSLSIKSPIGIIQRLMSVKSEDNGSGSESSFMPRIRKSVDNLSLSIKGPKLPERRISDVTDISRQNFTYKQGSENLGSRIAHLDYADPRTLFSSVNTTSTNESNVLINKSSVMSQRDSVFSLTSSNDSVNDPKNNINISDQKVSNVNMEDSYYEEKVEACLEDDTFFRDSAIYSDDNERRIEEDLKTKMFKSTLGNNPANMQQPPKVPKKPIRSPAPPPVPMKPSFIFTEQKRKMSDPPVLPSAQVISPSSNNGKEAKGWVLQQIKNFDK